MVYNRGNPTTALLSGSSGIRNTKFSAVKSGDTIVLDSFYTGSDVKVWRNGSDIDNKQLYMVHGHSTFDAGTGLLLQSFDRTVIGINDHNKSSVYPNVIHVAASSDAVYIEKVSWSPNPDPLPKGILLISLFFFN